LLQLPFLSAEASLVTGADLLIDGGVNAALCSGQLKLSPD
jgi:hypothetical protein